MQHWPTYGKIIHYKTKTNLRYLPLTADECSLQARGLWRYSKSLHITDCNNILIVHYKWQDYYCTQCITILLTGKNITLLNCFPQRWFLLTFKPPPLSYISANLLYTTLHLLRHHESVIKKYSQYVISWDGLQIVRHVLSVMHFKFFTCYLTSSSFYEFWICRRGRNQSTFVMWPSLSESRDLRSHLGWV